MAPARQGVHVVMQKGPPSNLGTEALKSRSASRKPRCFPSGRQIAGWPAWGGERYSRSGAASRELVSERAPSTSARPASLATTRSMGRAPSMALFAFMNSIAASRPNTVMANWVTSPCRRAAACERRDVVLRFDLKCGSSLTDWFGLILCSRRTPRHKREPKMSLSRRRLRKSTAMTGLLACFARVVSHKRKVLRLAWQS